MRWICWASVPLAVWALANSAAGFDGLYGGGGSCASCEHQYTYGAPACAAPFYGFQPGCCEQPPSPCDNAWAGYCQEKARCRAFWYRLGTGGRVADCGSTCGGCQAIPGDGQPTPADAEPAAPAEPADAVGAPRPPVSISPSGSAAPPAPPPPGTPGWPGMPPAFTAPGGPAEPPLPPVPSQLEGPTAVPPPPESYSQETTWRWDRFWLPRSSARAAQTEWAPYR